MSKNNLTPDPAHDVTGNGEWSHYDLARQLEMRGYRVDADPEDNQHSYVYFEDNHVGDIHGDEEATVTTIESAEVKISEGCVSLYQGEDQHDRVFGYVSGDGGGFFFTWMPTLAETLDSIEEDEIDGDGGLRKSDVRDFLESYLPTTPGGRKRDW